MSQDDPFSTVDSDKTVIMPSPGGRSAQPGQAAEGWHTTISRGTIKEIDELAAASGLNPLIAAANPLLNIVPQLRATLQHPDPSGLRDYLAQNISRSKLAPSRLEWGPKKLSEPVTHFVRCLMRLPRQLLGAAEYGPNIVCLSCFTMRHGAERNFFSCLQSWLKIPQPIVNCSNSCIYALLWALKAVTASRKMARRNSRHCANAWRRY